jgi:phosphomannomutase/phosphoglucomutase
MELKVIIAGEILVKEKTQRLLRSIDDTELLKNNWGKLEENNSFVEEYIGMICEDIRLTRPMKIILDGNTGASGLLMTHLLQEIGCEVLHPPSKLNETPLDDNSDSTINNNLDNLSASVRMHQADFGVTFHQDGAVLNLVDSQGKIISPEQLIMLFSQAVLASYPGSEIILDDQCPEQLIKYIGANRGRSITCKAEPLLIKAELKVTAAKFAGDLYGRFYFNDRWFGFEDALYATCRLVEILSSDKRSSSEVFASLD